MDYYEIMVVPRAASDDEIKRAYRKLARMYHPDVNPDDEKSVEKFKEIQNIYDVLSDPHKKMQYDQLGYVGRRSVGKPNPPKATPKTKQDFEKEKAQDSNDRKSAASDAVDCTYFGGGSTGRNIMVHLKLTPQQMKLGGTKYIGIKRRDLCKMCIGDGSCMRMCLHCQGRKPDIGWCQVCDGIGAIQTKCHACNGDGLKEMKVHTVRVNWSPNVQPGHTITILGEGEAAPNKAPGQLRVVVI
jgi:molecular chaperone DnaJ